MKAIYVDRLHPIFASEMEKRGFHLHGKPPKAGAATKALYVKRERDDLSLFVVLRPNRKQEFFHLDLGWTRTGKLPKITDDHLPRWTDEVSEFRQSARTVDFVDIYHRAFAKTLIGWMVWDCSADPLDPKYIEIFMREDAEPVSPALADERCRTAVEQCMLDFDAVAMPLFDRLVAVCWRGEKGPE